jgi:16S rRNA (cytosine967-C5)-methyltransferase
MPISPARTAAFDILLRVQQEDAFASELLHAPKQSRLSPADHALTTELVMGVLRWRSLLDENIRQVSDFKLGRIDSEVLVSLRIAAYQLLFLDRVPASAAIDESVELVKRARKRSAAGFANAVLRKLSRLTTTPEVLRQTILNASSPGALADASSHPAWLLERWVLAFGLDAARQICLSNQSVPVTTIRLRAPTVEAERELQGAQIQLAPGAFLASARRVVNGDITKTQAFREGRISIQDEASQLVAWIAGQGRQLLDCCAAPGGKTSILADRNPESTIIAVDLHAHRARLLARLVDRTNVHIVTADAARLPFHARFDRVLADVPCSGTGTLSRNPEIKWRLRPDDLLDLQSRQLAILQSAMTQVKAGGKLAYSTCSLEREENAVVVQKALTQDPSFRLEDCRSTLADLKSKGELTIGDLDRLLEEPYLRTLPGVFPTDGFFAAILSKVG